jgi:GNAT superfamily N-acetyltransferase
MTTLAWGKILYIDDLITKNTFTGKGYGKMLLDHATKIAKDNACQQVHLDTGYTRHAAHRLYLKQGFELNCHHLVLKLK